MTWQELSAEAWRFARSPTGAEIWTVAAIFAAALLAAIVLVRRRRSGLFNYGRTPTRSTDSLIEHLIPRNMAFGIVLALLLAMGTWAIGFLIARERGLFLASREWQYQPLYMVVHMITLGSFIRVFTGNFRIGVRNLAVGEGALDGWIAQVLGWRGMLAAACIAVPFAALDFRYLISERYQKLGGANVPGSVDYLMWGIWSLEWSLNAFIWVILAAFLYKNASILRSYQFADPIDVVVQEKKYRPFLRMSAQGASVVLAFSFVTVGYIWYTGGELTDYAGLSITLALLMAGFLVPLSMLRRKVRRAVERERHALQRAVAADPRLDVMAPRRQEMTADLATIQHRLDAALTLLRLSHLDRLHLNLGATEARALLMRLAAPVLTIAWQVYANWGEIMRAFARYGKVLTDRFGLPI